MLLTVLGCSGSVPGPDSPASGYLVRAGNTSVVLDLGNGTFGALQRHIDPFDLDALILSHLHSDHCADVSALTVYRRYHPRRTTGRWLALHGPSALADRLAAAYATDAAERARTDLSDVFDFRPFPDPSDQPVRIGALEMRTAAVDHPCEAYAVRISQAGAVLVYSGDTGPCRSLVELASGADVLLAEASWPHRASNPGGIHLSGRDAGQIAATAGVARLLITHVPPWTDAEQMCAEARAVFAGPVELVRAGADYEI